MHLSPTEHTPKALWKDQLFWFLMIVGATLGMVVSFLPPLFPALGETFSASLEQLGRSQLVFFGTGLVYSVAGGWITARLGLRRAAAFSYLMIAAGMTFVATANGLWTIFAGATLNGIGHVGIATSASAIISNCYPDRRQSVFIIWGISASVGFAAGPALYGWWLDYAAAQSFAWQPGVYGYAILYAAVGLWGRILRTERREYDEVGHREGGGSRDAMRSVLRSPVFYLASWWIFCHALAQIGISSWIGLYARQQYGISLAQAAWFLSANAIGFFIGRIILSWITTRWSVPELVVLTVSSLATSVLFAATILAPTYALSITLFLVAGIFTCGNAPSVQSYFGMRFMYHAATAFALLGGIGNIGAASGPYIIGIVGTYIGLGAGIWIMPAFMVALGTTSLIWWIVRERHAARPVRVEPAEVTKDPTM